MGHGHLARLALDRGAEHDAIVASGAHRALDATEDIGRRGRQREGGIGEDGVAGLGRLVCLLGERPCHRLRQVEAVALHDGAGVRERGRVGNGGTEPITAGSSPGTSEMPTVTTLAG